VLLLVESFVADANDDPLALLGSDLSLGEIGDPATLDESLYNEIGDIFGGRFGAVSMANILQRVSESSQPYRLCASQCKSSAISRRTQFKLQTLSCTRISREAILS